MLDVEINEQETVEYMEKLNSVLEYFGQLDELPTEDVIPTYHVAEIYNVFREDVVENPPAGNCSCKYRI